MLTHYAPSAIGYLLYSPHAEKLFTLSHVSRSAFYLRRHGCF